MAATESIPMFLDAPGDVVCQATAWQDNAPCRVLGPGDGLHEGEFCWLDVSTESTVEAVLRVAGAWCAGQLKPEHVRDLLTVEDDQRECVTYGDGDVRLARGFSAHTQPPAQRPGRSPLVGDLVLSPVNVVVGGSWVLTCRHAPRRFHGADLVACNETVRPLEACLDAVQRRWMAGLGARAADLGILILHELALTFAPAHREVAKWLESWELNLYRDNRLDRLALPQLWGEMALLREWVAPLNRPGMRTNIDKAWFRGATDHNEIRQVDDRVDKALSNLADLGRLLRASFAMQQSRIEESDRARKEDRQRRIEYLAAIFLMPTLVVGFYGANTWLPASNHHTRFWDMVTSAVVLTAFVVTCIWLVNRRRDESLVEHR